MYKHKKTDRKVILVGAIHVGKVSYYQRIQHLIDQAASEGFRILYEGVGKMDDKDIAKLPKKQQIIVHQMKASSAFIQGITKKLFDEDVVYQKHGLKYPKWWIRTDLDVSHVSELLTEANVNFWSDSDKRPDANFLDKLPESVSGFIKIVVHTSIKLLPGISMITSITSRFDAKKRIRNHVIITMRDEVAAHGILEHAEHANVLSIWGAAHIPGIHRHLTKAGYQHMTTKWFDAFWT